MANALRFKQANIARQQGELARLKVVQGPDYGATYVVVGQKAFIGRGEENDVVISDLKASRIHAEISLFNGVWIVKDKGSANGILHNGRSVREAQVITGDTFTVGETTLEFMSSDSGTMMLKAPPRPIEQVQAEQNYLVQHHEKMGAMGLQTPVSAPAGPGGLLKDRRVLLVLGVLVAAVLIFGDNSPPNPKSKKKTDSVSDLASFLPTPDFNKAAETLFKDGLREYFAGNYGRARTQFETVLQITPGHPLATLYLENCNTSVNAEVKVHLERGKKALQAGKLKESKAHFERILRLLFKDQTNPSYVEAKDQLEKVNKLISNEGGSN